MGPTACAGPGTRAGTSFLVSGTVTALLFCLSLCAIWCLANPLRICPLWGGTGSFHCGMRGCVQKRPAGRGRTPTIKLVLLCLFSVCVKRCSIRCLTVVFSLRTLTPRHSGQRSSDFRFWRWEEGCLCCLSRSWSPPRALMTGIRFSAPLGLITSALYSAPQGRESEDRNSVSCPRQKASVWQH